VVPERERALTERAIAERRPPRGVPRRWQRGKLLGSGAYGQVFLALDMDSGAELAVKQVELRGDGGETNIKVCVCVCVCVRACACVCVCFALPRFL
jgi:hypothetical protein